MLISFGCQDKGYRTEVMPGEEGRYTLNRVPEDPDVIARHHAQAAVAKDPDLTTLDNDWQRLSPQDRKTVLDPGEATVSAMIPS